MPRDFRRVSRSLVSVAAALSLGCVVRADPRGPVSPAAPAQAAPAVRRTLPDYGGRDGALDSTLGGSGVGGAPDPLAQAGRAFEALVIVLVVIAGGLVLLKRSGLIKGDVAMALKGGPMSWASSPQARRPEADGTDGLPEMLELLGSRTLPHSSGAGLHLVSVGGRVLLLGATAQSVTLLTEVAHAAPPEPERETPEEVAAFADYLERLGLASPPPAGAGPAPATLSAATERLQSLLAQGRDGRTRG